MIHIVPAVPPEFNGLGDYARQLWRNWPEPEPPWSIAALRVPEGAQMAWPGPRFYCFEPNASSLVRTLRDSEAELVVLHYVGYGYSPDGVPTWLPDALAKWKSSSGGRLVTFFHELWAFGPPWTRPFWSAYRARSVTLQIQKLSDEWATSCHRYIRLMRGHERRRTVGHRIPIGANIQPTREAALRAWPTDIGEPVRTVLFGAPGTRLLALKDHRRLIRSWSLQGLLESVHLVGRSADPHVDQQIRGILQEAGVPKVVERYDLNEQDCSKAISEGNVSLIHNRWDILHKSTAYSCSAMHGLCCVVPHCHLPAGAPVWSTHRRQDAIDDAVEVTRSSRERERQELAWSTITSQWRDLV